MNKQDNDIKKLLKEIREEGRGFQKTPCPSEEILSLFAEGGLIGPEKDQVQNHLSLCPDCLDTLLLARKTNIDLGTGTSLQPVPAGFVEKAKALVSPGKDIMLFDLIVNFTRNSLEIVHSLLTPLPPLVQPAGAALRGDLEEPLLEPIRVEKELDGVVVELEISSPGKDAWTVHVLLKKTNKKQPPEGLRVTLKDMDKERELQSFLVRKSVVSFQDLSNGEYTVEIKDKGIHLGELTFCLDKA